MSAAIDEQALAAERKYLYFYALMRLRDADLAEDAVQDTLVAALRNRESFAGRSALRTWLVAILRNKIVDLVRSRGREVTLPDGEDERGEEEFDALFRENGHWTGTAAPSTWADPHASMERDDFWRVFQMCLDALPPRTGEVFALREVLGESIPDICKNLGITETNCSVMLFRARMRLRVCLEQDWFGGARG